MTGGNRGGAWLELPVASLFAVLVVFYGLTTAILYWLTFRSPTGAQAKSLTGVVAPFFAATSVLFALLTGFLANDVGDRNRQAWRAVNGEASAIAGLHTLSIASASDMAAIRTALRAYVRSALTEEWARMADAGFSPHTDGALADLLREVSDPAIARDAGQAVHTALLDTVIRIREARSVRLALASDRTNDLKWATVLILGVITQIAIALVHLERPRAQLAALVVFSAAAIVALGLIALQEQPFDGAIRISPDPLLEALRFVAGP
jgi:uncharacterized membrane protein HdeD (DUF308 family)